MTDLIREMADKLGVEYPELTPFEEQYGSPYIKDHLMVEHLQEQGRALGLDDGD